MITSSINLACVNDSSMSCEIFTVPIAHGDTSNHARLHVTESGCSDDGMGVTMNLGMLEQLAADLPKFILLVKEEQLKSIIKEEQLKSIIKGKK